MRLIQIKGFILIWIAFFLCPSSSSIQKEDPVDSITVEELKDHIFFFASDFLEGRYLDSKGFNIAAHYGASQFKAAGLVPVIQTDEGRTNFQDVPVLKRSTKDDPVMIVKASASKNKLVHGQDFKWVEGDIYHCKGKPLSVVFVGYGISESENG